MGKRVLVFSNSVWAPTGYGGQTKQLTSRLVKDGYEVAVHANWGLSGAPQNHAGMTIFPGGAHPYSLDTADFIAHTWLDGHDGIVIVLYDTWPLLEHAELYKGLRAYYWAPIDHDPVPPKVLAWVREHPTIAMSKWGQQKLAAAGVTSDYIPHAIETSIFRPTPSDMRTVLRVPEDAHVSLALMANIGQSPVRKAWFENLIAWGTFAAQHEDAYLYIHTQLQHPRGVDLASCIIAWGLPQDRVRVVDQGAYANGFIAQDDLTRIISAGDVLLMATAGEGFGVPAIEAQACGVPVIGTDFSAQSEVIGAGWKVPYAPLWDYFQMAMQASPSIPAIVDALEKSYATKQDPAADAALRAAAVAKAAEYDADRVYADYWRPWLDKVFHVEEPRVGMSNAAKRRARKAAKAA